MAYELGLIRTDRGQFLDKGNQVFDIRHPDFEGGAKGDGLSDIIPAITKALAHAAGLGPVYVPAGTWRCDSQIKIPSNTTLILDRDAVLVRNYSGSGDANALIRNDDFTSGNTNIRVFGGQLDIDASVTGANMNMVFDNVSHLTVEGVRFLSIVGGWCFMLRRVTDFIVHGIDIEGGDDVLEDGFHLQPGCKRGVISDMVIQSGDDCIALTIEGTQDDGVADPTIEDITISNIVGRSTYSRVFYIAKTVADTDRFIRRVNLHNVVGYGGETKGLALFDLLDTDCVYDINISNVHLDHAAAAEEADRESFYARGVNRLTVENVTVTNAWERSFRFINCDDLKLRGLRGLGKRSTTAENNGSVINLETCARVEAHDIHVNGFGADGTTKSAVHGMEVGNASSPCTDVKVFGFYGTGAATSGLRLSNCTRGHFYGIDSTGNGQGISEDSPSDYNHFYGGSVTGNSSSSLTLTGSNSYHNGVRGWTSYGVGQATITSGNTTVVVTHNLGARSVTNIRITPGTLGSAAKWWISDTSTTNQFTISVDVDPGVGGALFGWEVTRSKIP